MINTTKFGKFGGIFVPETLMSALEELEEAFLKYKEDINFQKELDRYLRDYAGRPTPLYFANNFSKLIGCKVYLKREDLVHGGSHKLNNCLGQALLAKKMGKSTLITETAAGQQGVATAIVGALFGMKVKVFMGVKDIERQSSNAKRITILGGEVIPVNRGNGVLKDAVDEALTEWMTTLKDAHYLLGSAVGPYPYPTIVRHFQSVIGKEIKDQIIKSENLLPNMIIACGSGGSNAIGAFYEFIDDKEVELMFIEGGGKDTKGNEHAAAFFAGRPGIFQGALTYLLQDQYGNDNKTESRATGLNYPARGPELSYLKDEGRIKAFYATDSEVLNAFSIMSKTEGIIPAFETSHAIAHLLKLKGKYKKEDIIILNFSGKGDKDIDKAIELLNTMG